MQRIIGLSSSQAIECASSLGVPDRRSHKLLYAGAGQGGHRRPAWDLYLAPLIYAAGAVEDGLDGRCN